MIAPVPPMVNPDVLVKADALLGALVAGAIPSIVLDSYTGTVVKPAHGHVSYIHDLSEWIMEAEGAERFAVALLACAAFIRAKETANG